MIHRKEYPVTVIRKSCLTGKAVWIYRGPSHNAARIAYWRACKKEIERIRQWPERMARRKAEILAFLSELTANLPPVEEMPPEKRALARKLLAMADEQPDPGRAFYDHIMEERRRKEEDRRIRQAMREREKAQNSGYDK